MKSNYNRDTIPNADGTFTAYVKDPAGNKIEELTITGKSKIGVGSKLGQAIKKFDFDKYEEENDVSVKAEVDPYKGLSGVDRLIAQSIDKGTYLEDEINGWTVKLVPQDWASTYKFRIGKISYSFDMRIDEKVIIFSNCSNRFGDNLTDVHMPKIMNKIDEIIATVKSNLAQISQELKEKSSYDKDLTPTQKKLGQVIDKDKSNPSTNKVLIWQFMDLHIIGEVTL